MASATVIEPEMATKPLETVQVAIIKPMSNECEQYRHLVSQYDWAVTTAMAIMRAESGCSPLADNTGLNRDGSNDKGLFQVNSIHHRLISDHDRLIPEKNIAVAYQIYKGSGWKAWSAYNNKAYLKYL